MNALAIIEAATADGLAVDLSPTGSLKAIGAQETVNRWRPLLKQHKAEIVNLLSKEPGGAIEATRPTVPSWCNPRCGCYHRLEVPDVGTQEANATQRNAQWCCQETDETHWRRDRLDTMSGCPLAEERQ
jgi:hypothetical protein